MKKYAFFLLLPLLAFQVFNPLQAPGTKKLKKDFAYVPSGLVVREGDTLSVQAFYISKGEVTNKEYRLFLADLKASNKMELYNMALPDTSLWKKISPAFADYYFSHPAYDEYPVVNISYEAAQEYCKWFTDKMNAVPKSKYVYQFRLPEREEFIRACRGDQHHQAYSWKFEGVRNNKGDILCNHVHGEAQIAGSLSYLFLLAK